MEITIKTINIKATYDFIIIIINSFPYENNVANIDNNNIVLTVSNQNKSNTYFFYKQLYFSFQPKLLRAKL